MNRATRDKFTASTDQTDLTVGQACWETPPEVFEALDREFKFDIDLCGGPGTQHRLPLYFGPGGHAEDALSCAWTTNGARGNVGFCNPPYGSFIPKILAKGLAESRVGFTSVFLLPNRMTRWYKHMMWEAREIRIVDERIAFLENGQPRINPKTGKPDGALFDSCIVVIGPKPARLFPRASFEIWHWNAERNAKCRLSQ